jgi:hypothetical protein
MSVSETFRGVVDESVALTESAAGTNRFHLEPRCRICRNDQVRTKVNDLLATGASYAMVLRALGDDNANLEQRDQVTIARSTDSRSATALSRDHPRGTICYISPIKSDDDQVVGDPPQQLSTDFEALRRRLLQAEVEVDGGDEADSAEIDGEDEI